MTLKMIFHTALYMWKDQIGRNVYEYSQNKTKAFIKLCFAEKQQCYKIILSFKFEWSTYTINPVRSTVISQSSK